MNEQNSSSGNPLNALENWFEDIFGRKAPQLPEKWREVIVKITPWVTLIIMLLALPAVLFVLGIGAVVLPVTAVVTMHTGGMYWIGFILAVVALVLEAIAIPGLFKRSLASGWRFVYWASLITAISGLLSLNFGSLIGLAISLYILFQIKKYYR